MTEPRSTALIVDASQSVAMLLSSYVRLAVGTGAEVATSFEQLRSVLSDSPERFYVAVVDLAVDERADAAAVDYVLGHNIPAIVLTAAREDARREQFVDKNVIDFVVKSSAGEIENVTNIIHRVYNNRFVKVLIVDPSPSYRHYLRSLLGMHHYKTLEAGDGEQALAQLQEHPDLRLVLVDHALPDMDGLQLLDAIRQAHDRSELAILGLAGEGDEKLPARMLKGGANDFIAKPLVVEEFHCRVTNCIETIEHIRLVEESATRDYLTRAYNRRYLFEAGVRLHENAKRGNLTLVAAMIDADHFKAVNDAHGHHIGDVVLKEISATLANCLRQSDLIARFGGEEFCVLATGLDDVGAVNVFDRVRREIAALRIPVDRATIRITVSIGVCLSLEDSLESMINQADVALYTAKSEGRNRVIVAAA